MRYCEANGCGWQGMGRCSRSSVFRVGIQSQCLTMLPEAEAVGQANNGPDALRQAQTLQPDLVLLDIVMPHMSGLGVAAHTKAAS